MGGDKKEDVNAGSAEFKQGVEAGLNSAEDTKNWKAGNELGRELREAGETKGPGYGCLNSRPPTPLFMRNSLEGRKGNAQDEKDTTEE
jgi:hypothetical protein